MQETVARATDLLHRYPWLILVGGALVGSQLRRAHRRPVRPVPPPPPRAAVTLPREPPPARVSPMVSEAPRQPLTEIAAPSAPGEPTPAAPPDPRPSAWKFGGLGVTELGRRVIAEIRDDDCLGRAAQLAYYFLFALFPFFLFLTTLLGYLPIPDLLDRLLETLGQMLPARRSGSSRTMSASWSPASGVGSSPSGSWRRCGPPPARSPPSSTALTAPTMSRRAAPSGRYG